MSGPKDQKLNWKHPVHLIAGGFGAGAVPKMPGTAGSLVALPLISALHPLGFIVNAVVLVCVVLLGTWVSERVSQDLGVEDHSSIVIDEIAGMLLAFLWAPVSLISLLVGFVLFRVFDIWKPWPISWVDQHIHGGIGVMLDDVLAGGVVAVLMPIFLNIADI